MARKVIGSRGECTSVVFLSLYLNKLPSKYLLIYTKVLHLTLVREASDCSWRQLTQKPITGHCWKWVMVECSLLNGTSISPPERLREHLRRGGKWCKILEMKGVLLNTIIWAWHIHCSHELPETAVAYTSLDTCWYFLSWMGEEFMRYHLPKEVLTMNGCWGSGKFLFNGVVIGEIFILQ